MSTSTVTSDPVEPERLPGRSRRRWWLAGLAVAVVVSVGAVAWVWRHPDQSFSGSYGMEVRRPVGHTVWTTLVHSGEPGADKISISSLEPHFETDGAEATVEYVICELDPEVLDRDGVGGFGYGLRDRDVERYCTRTRPAVGATFALRSQPPEELLVGVTPTRDGRTVITGHRMTFGVGWQRGTAELDVELRIIARG